MKKKSKRYKKLIEYTKEKKKAELKDIIDLIKETSTAKFDESIDVAFYLNLKKKKEEVSLRTSVKLPNGNGLHKRATQLFALPDVLWRKILGNKKDSWGASKH